MKYKRMLKLYKKKEKHIEKKSIPKIVQKRKTTICNKNSFSKITPKEKKNYGNNK